MLAPTHSVFGLFLTLILLAVFGIKEGLHWSILLVATIGSLMPDIDLPSSLIGRLLFFISKPLERRFTHRTITHSLIGWALATTCFSLIVGLVFSIPTLISVFPAKAGIQSVTHAIGGWLTFSKSLRLIAAFSIGYASHILLDMFNPMGVQLLWPNDARDVIPGNPKFRPNTGSKAEGFVFIAFSLLLILALPISSNGLMPSLRWLLATPQAAIEEFENNPYRTYVTFEGYFQDTKKPVSGTAEVLDVQNKKLIVLFPSSLDSPSHPPSTGHPPAPSLKGSKTPSSFANLSDEALSRAKLEATADKHIYILSDDSASDILVSKIRTLKTKAPVSTTHLLFEDQTPDSLLLRLSDFDLVSGTITLPPNIAIDLNIPGLNTLEQTLKPIKQSGNKLILSFASKAQLKALKLKEATLKHQKNLQFQLESLNRKRTQLLASLDKLIPKSDLTPLGQSILNNPDMNLDSKHENLQLRLDQIEHQILDLKEQIDGEKLLLSGEVRVRKV